MEQIDRQPTNQPTRPQLVIFLLYVIVKSTLRKTILGKRLQYAYG